MYGTRCQQQGRHSMALCDFHSSPTCSHKILWQATAPKHCEVTPVLSTVVCMSLLRPKQRTQDLALTNRNGPNRPLQAKRDAIFRSCSS